MRRSRRTCRRFFLFFFVPQCLSVFSSFFFVPQCLSVFSCSPFFLFFLLRFFPLFLRSAVPVRFFFFPQCLSVFSFFVPVLFSFPFFFFFFSLSSPFSSRSLGSSGDP